MKPRELGISILEYVKNCHLRRVTKRKNKHRYKMLRDNNIPIRKLTTSEKREVKSFFKQYIKPFKEHRN